MATFDLVNVNNVNTDLENEALQGMTQEFIQIHGVNMWYFKRTAENIDIVLGEDPTSKFEEKYLIEMYINTYDGFGGNRDLYTEHGLDVNDEILLDISIRSWKEHVHSKNSYLYKPIEGDLIFYPFSRQIFEILHVEDESPHYAMGKQSVFSVKARHFDYSHESIDVEGISGVDIKNMNEIDHVLDNIFDLEQTDTIKSSWHSNTTYNKDHIVIDFETNTHFKASNAGTSGLNNPFTGDKLDVIDGDILWKLDKKKSNAGRMVMYVDNLDPTYSLNSLITTQYTDIILSRVSVLSDGTITTPVWYPNISNPDLQSITDTINSGKNVWISLGGSSQTRWLMSDIPTVVSSVKSVIDSLGLYGVDIDFEETSMFNDGIGQDYLIALTNALYTAGITHISHSPLAPYISKSLVGSHRTNKNSFIEAYTDVHLAVGNKIESYFIRFFNNPAWESPSNITQLLIDLTDGWIDNVQATRIQYQPEKLFIGLPTSAVSATSGYLTPTDVNTNIIPNMPKGISGIMAYEYIQDINWSPTIINTLTQDSLDSEKEYIEVKRDLDYFKDKKVGLVDFKQNNPFNLDILTEDI